MCNGRVGICPRVGIKKENSISNRQETHLVAASDHSSYGSDLVSVVQVDPRRPTRTKSRECSLSHWGDGGNGRGGHVVDINYLGSDFRRSVLLRAVSRDMAGLAALVTSLASGVKGTAVGSGAITRNMTQLATGVALHGLRLTVTGEVVGAAALVTSSGTGTTEATSAVATSKTTTAHRSTTAHSRAADRVGASASKVTRLAAVITTATGTSAAQTKGRAVSLNVAKALAVVALLSLSSTGKRAAVGLMARLLAVVAEALSGRANLSVVANVATFVASTTREGGHD